MGIEAFGIDRASRFATEHPGLRLKFKPRVKSPAPAGLFFKTRQARDPYGVSRRAENRSRINPVMMSTASRAPSAGWRTLTLRRAYSRTVLASSRVDVPWQKRLWIKPTAKRPPATADA